MRHRQRNSPIVETPKKVPVHVDDLIISTARYYTGRTTALASTFAMQLAHAWPQLSAVVQAQIRKDLEHAFERDDQARHSRDEGWAAPYERLPLGHDVDRQAWEAVRRAWGAGLAPAQPQPPATPGPRPQLDLFPKRPLEAEEHSPCYRVEVCYTAEEAISVLTEYLA